MGIAFKPWPALAGAFMALLAPVQGASGAIVENSDFEGYPVASNQELEALRGGFEISIGGQLLSLAFSLERVTYLNGQLQALTRISIPDLAAAILSPRAVSVESYIAPPTVSENQPVPQAAPGEAGNLANPSTQISTFIVSPEGSTTSGASMPSGQAGNSFVTLIQNGPGNSVALPAQMGEQLNQQVNQQVGQAIQAVQAQVLQAQNQATIIQNTLDNQVIQNLTTLNVTLTNAALARAVELNAALQGLLNRPIVVQP